jgi:hypothetical protein
MLDCPTVTFLSLTFLSLGLVYKEGSAHFKKADNNGQLTNLGMLSLQRWKKGILVVHFLFPLEKQASNTCTAEGLHGQATFADFVQAMRKGSTITVLILR